MFFFVEFELVLVLSQFDTGYVMGLAAV